MRRRLNSGTSLIEILTVIVVFLVGILGLLQAFPGGLGLLRTTRSNTLAATLARSEMQRIQGSVDIMPEMIVPVIYRAGGTVIEVQANQPWTDLLPERDPAGGQLDISGNILVNSSPIGQWQKVSGANKFNRVIGEGRRAPAPNGLGATDGGLVQLQFGPIYYTRDSGTGVAAPGVLTVYANDLQRRWGSIDRGRPNLSQPGRDYEFFFVDAENADNAPYPSEDQILVPVPRDANGNRILAPLRITLAFGYQNGSSYDQHEVIVTLDPATAAASVVNQSPNWLAVNLRNLIAEPGAYGSSGFDPANFVSAEPGSVRVQRMYREISLATAFTPGNPYEFRALNGELGTLVLNPAASLAKVAQPDGSLVPLEVNTDYTVLDWRLMRDSFRVPVSNSWPSVRLALAGLKSMSSNDTDGTPYEGLGFDVPNGENVVGPTDFALVDEATGGIVLGNQPGATYHSYFVDKRNGAITLVDRSTDDGVQIYIALPQPDGSWNPTLFEASRRSLRAVYQANGEWAVQMHKAASSYRVSGWVTGTGLQPGETLLGLTPNSSGTPIGTANRLYFPLSDLGHRVTVGEVRWENGGTGPGSYGVLRDQEFVINGTETVNGALLAYADLASRLPGGAQASQNRTGYAIKGVKGASFRVRVLWNPQRFALLPDAADNYRQFEGWMQETRPVQTEGFVSPGASQ